jgi:peptide/nickel transport system permease protein
MRNKKLTPILIVGLAIVNVLVLLAGFVSPNDPVAQDRNFAYAPPTHIHFSDSSGLRLRPFIYGQTGDVEGYREDQSREYPVRLLVRGESYSLFWILKSNVHLIGVEEPGRLLLLGADAFGRDELSRLLYGGQISLAAGLTATVITLLAATLAGAVSGYCGAWVDDSLMAASELFLALPWFYFLIGVRAFLPLHISPEKAFLLLVGIIGLIGWARPARLIRGIVLSARSRNYVLAAMGFGASGSYLLRRHILPEAYGVLLTQAALLIPQYIAAEATLSFFGLGISEPTPSWGNMLSALQQYHVLVSYTWLLAPAAALVITSVIYWLLADSLHNWLQSHSI